MSKVTITGNINGKFLIYDNLFDSGTQLKGYYKNGLTPRRGVKYDKLFRFFVILDYSCDNITVNEFMHEKFIWNTDDFIYVEVTNSFIPNKFRNRIFNLRKGSSKVFKTSTHSWYFGKDLPHTIVVFEKSSINNNKYKIAANVADNTEADIIGINTDIDNNNIDVDRIIENITDTNVSNDSNDNSNENVAADIIDINTDIDNNNDDVNRIIENITDINVSNDSNDNSNENVADNTEVDIIDINTDIDNNNDDVNRIIKNITDINVSNYSNDNLNENIADNTEADIIDINTDIDNDNDDVDKIIEDITDIN
ncbi:5297_t:CDS:2, partial [Entrophospora sp. SA101]